MDSSVQSRCQTRAGVYMYFNKTLECFTITDSMFSKSSGMNDAKEHIHKLGYVWLEQLNFLPPLVLKWEQLQ